MIDRNKKNVQSCFDIDNFATMMFTNKNLNQIITMVINWPNDLYLDYTHSTCIKDCLKVKRFLVDDNYDLIEES